MRCIRGEGKSALLPVACGRRSLGSYPVAFLRTRTSSLPPSLLPVSYTSSMQYSAVADTLSSLSCSCRRLSLSLSSLALAPSRPPLRSSCGSIVGYSTFSPPLVSYTLPLAAATPAQEHALTLLPFVALPSRHRSRQQGGHPLDIALCSTSDGSTCTSSRCYLRCILVSTTAS